MSAAKASDSLPRALNELRPHHVLQPCGPGGAARCRAAWDRVASVYMAGGLWILALSAFVALSAYIAVKDWIDRERAKRRALRRSSGEVQIESELQSWLECLKTEYAEGHLTLEQLELEVERHMRLHNEAVRPGERREPQAVVAQVTCPHDDWEEVQRDAEIAFFICTACGTELAMPRRFVDQPALDWARVPMERE